VFNNCDTSIEYIQEHYFHYDAKRATGALATGRKSLKATIQVKATKRNIASCKPID
jgi:hypothetical protein